MMSNEFVETSSNANGKRLLDIRNRKDTNQ
jgi:hypothetical protein